jgi:tripartite-type tricarboxylate transporter receptor subunit TctC
MSMCGRLATFVWFMAFCTPAFAQIYPTRSITLVVPTAAGGAADAIARAVSVYLSQRLGQTIVIENKPGANNQIAAEYVAKSQPDGHVLFFAPETTFVVNPIIYSKLPYDPVKDFVPITGLAAVYQVLAAHPTLPAQNVAELVAFGKTKPGSVNFGTFGLGSSGHLNMEAFQAASGAKFTPVHYRGAAPAFADVLAGHIPLMFVSFGSTIQSWRSGKIKLLGIGRSQRLERYPELPTIAEQGVPGFEAKSWFGLFAPARTPPAVVARINAEVQQVFATAEFREKFLDANQMEAIVGSPEVMSEQIKKELGQWAKVIREGNLKLD